MNAGSNVTVLDPASWPSAKDMELDDSQFNALQLALTKEFAVIQGPPGTGKTYIGLKVYKHLLLVKDTENILLLLILVGFFASCDQFLVGRTLCTIIHMIIECSV